MECTWWAAPSCLLRSGELHPPALALAISLQPPWQRIHIKVQQSTLLLTCVAGCDRTDVCSCKKSGLAPSIPRSAGRTAPYSGPGDVLEHQNSLPPALGACGHFNCELNRFENLRSFIQGAGVIITASCKFKVLVMVRRVGLICAIQRGDIAEIYLRELCIPTQSDNRRVYEFHFRAHDDSPGAESAEPEP